MYIRHLNAILVVGGASILYLQDSFAMLYIIDTNIWLKYPIEFPTDLTYTPYSRRFWRKQLAFR
jgi:hypothetical protein